MKNIEEEAYSSPSFNYYSSDKLDSIAAQIASDNKHNNEDDEEEFEFTLIQQDDEEEFVIDQSIYSDRFRHVRPVFHKDLTSNREDQRLESSITNKLLIDDDRDYPASCSSSESDESEILPAGRYCVWRWKKNETTTSSSPSLNKKSKSTGSTFRRCKLPGFLRRSNSEGKGDFVFLTPKAEKSKRVVRRNVAGVAPLSQSPSAHEALYLRNRAVNESYKKKSYLPYRQDLLGFFASVRTV